MLFFCTCMCVLLYSYLWEEMYSQFAFGCSSKKWCHMDFWCAEREYCSNYVLDGIESCPFWYLVMLSYHCLNYMTYRKYSLSIGNCALSTNQSKVHCWPIPSHQLQKSGTCSKLQYVGIKSSIRWCLGVVSRNQHVLPVCSIVYESGVLTTLLLAINTCSLI